MEHGVIFDECEDTNAIEREIIRVEMEMDFLIAIMARGGPDAVGVREEITRLENYMGELISQREACRLEHPDEES